MQRSADVFARMADAPSPRLANMAKGTLPVHYASSRADGYVPEKVVVRDTRRGVLWTDAGVVPQPSIAQQFYTSENRQAIARAVVKSLGRPNVTESQIADQTLADVMARAYEIFGSSAANAPQARVGPSESMAYLAPPSAYANNTKDADETSDITRLNALTARLLTEHIVSEQALLSRYHSDLGGAIEVLPYPQLPSQKHSRYTPLQNPYYSDLTSEPFTGQRNMLSGPAYRDKRT